MGRAASRRSRAAFRAAPVRVRVPATSANLGPGFDALGLALALYDDVVVRVAEEGLYVDVAGEGADSVPRTRRHLVVRALHAGFDTLGGQPRGLEVVCANRIPHSRGLGSSAAAIVAGLVAARALVLGGLSGVATYFSGDKLILTIDVGDRTLTLAQRLVHQVAQVLAPDYAPLFLTDGFREYLTALVTHYGQWMPPERRQAQGPMPKPRN